MVFQTMVFFIIGMTAIYLVQSVSGLFQECIVGGFPANRKLFKYQVEIQSRKNLSKIYTSICGGGILTDQLIITGAHCFITKSKLIENLSFSVRLATDNLDSRKGYSINIDTIYSAPYNDSNMFHDIAIAKLVKSMDIINNRLLDQLRLPRPNDLFYNLVGAIAGFGFTHIQQNFNLTAQKLKVYGENSNSRLHFLYVTIFNNVGPMAIRHVNFNSINHLLAKSNIDSHGVAAGTCFGDSGSPLVVNNKVVGILSKCLVDCNDTLFGSIYTKVTRYLYFITGVMRGSLSHDTLTFQNLPHVLH